MNETMATLAPNYAEVNLYLNKLALLTERVRGEGGRAKSSKMTAQ